MSAVQEIDTSAFDHSEVPFATNTFTLRSSGVDGNYPAVLTTIWASILESVKTANLHQLMHAAS
jgi:hypothetical protein